MTWSFEELIEELTRRAKQRDQLRCALEGIVCPSCDHILVRHVGREGCEHDRGKVGTVALGPCSCQGEEFTEVAQAVKALRECGDSNG